MHHFFSPMCFIQFNSITKLTESSLFLLMSSCSYLTHTVTFHKY